MEPEHRLVARQLAKDWEAKLAAEQQLQEEYRRFTQQPPRVLAASERDVIRELAVQLPALWHAATTTVAERFGKANRKFKTPKVESTGTGGGIKLFCDGVGVQYPDAVNASRRIKQSEIDACRAHGVSEVIEVKIGFDGIVLAHSRQAPAMNVTLAQLWLALAKEIPDPKRSGKLIPNPHRTWKDVDARLPATRIEVLGPPPTSGTRDAFAELAMEGGCGSVAWIAALKNSDESRFRTICHTVREDGVYVEAGENDNLIVQKLVANPRAFGVFGFSFLDQNADKLTAARVNGVAPEYEAIADGSYPVSRALYVYVKKSHVGVIPGLQELLTEYTSDRASGEEGYLSDKGLIALPRAQRTRVQSDVKALKPLPAKI
ncbi:MAG: phosphate ABC transporter substrate-binding protein [Gammaproteobacteria bacterium]|nr:phosphate ABC transporter substrate-binding protein [Gammaproteobacteria bacterium]